MTKKNYIVGVDLGGTFTKLAVVNLRGKVLIKRSIPTVNYRDKGRVIGDIVAHIKELIQDARLTLKDISGIGVGIAGLVNSEKGTIYTLVNIPGWDGLNLIKMFRSPRLWRGSRIKLPAFMDNDVNVMALGEFYHGAGRGAKNMLCITLGTGVGGGLILDGKLYRGVSSTAGEFGHMPIELDGPKCNCGARGCLERRVGNKYIVDAAQELIRKRGSNIIRKLTGGDLRKLTPKILSDAAKKGDKAALKIWRITGRRIGMLIAGVVNLLNLERVVIGGGVAGAGEVLFDAIRKEVSERAMPVPARAVRIVKAQLGPDAGVIGASVLVKLGKRNFA